MFVVCVEFEIKPSQTDVFMAAVRTNAEQSFHQVVKSSTISIFHSQSGTAMALR